MKSLTAKILTYQKQITAALLAHNDVLADDLSAGLKIAQDELDGLQQQWLAQGCDLPKTPHPIPTIVRVLVVLDGIGSFGPTDKDDKDTWFGLSTVIRTLTAPRKGILFSVTRAHRQTDPQDYSSFPAGDQAIFTPNYTHFKFDQFAGEGGLEGSFDVIFMLGYDGGAPDLSQPELKAIATFMNAGGGVFATGDHEDLGLAMCGGVLRVRNMRRWYFYGSPPPGLLLAPSGLGPERHDTLQSVDGGVSYHFDNQSDDTPQPLKLTLFGGLPHPLLRGPLGNIDKFPDHMHEGDVVVPSVTNESPVFDGATFVEYPWRTLSFKGHHITYQPLPEIVARGTVIGGHQTLADESAHASANDTNETSGTYDFGVVGAYDGHLVGVGRVAVDSTWHHFFDINLVGDPAAGYVGRTQETLGFTTAKGTPVLDGMRAYYQNLVLWLAPAKLKLSTLSSLLYELRFRQPLNELLAPRDHSPEQIAQIGEVARGALSSLIGESMALDLIHGWMATHPAAEQLPGTPFHANARAEAISHAQIAAAALGGAVIALARAVPTPRRIHRDELTAVVVRGLDHGLGVLGSRLRAQAHALGELAEAFGSAAEQRATKRE